MLRPGAACGPGVRTRALGRGGAPAAAVGVGVVVVAEHDLIELVELRKLREQAAKIIVHHVDGIRLVADAELDGAGGLLVGGEEAFGGHVRARAGRLVLTGFRVVVGCYSC